MPHRGDLPTLGRRPGARRDPPRGDAHDARNSRPRRPAGVNRVVLPRQARPPNAGARDLPAHPHRAPERALEGSPHRVRAGAGERPLNRVPPAGDVGPFSPTKRAGPRAPRCGAAPRRSWAALARRALAQAIRAQVPQEQGLLGRPRTPGPRGARSRPRCGLHPAGVNLAGRRHRCTPASRRPWDVETERGCAQDRRPGPWYQIGTTYPVQSVQRVPARGKESLPNGRVGPSGRCPARAVTGGLQVRVLPEEFSKALHRWGRSSGSGR